MNISELYTRVGGNYNDIKNALGSERIVQKYVLRFSDATCFQELSLQLEEGRLKEAFQSAHALKGICQNIGFATLRKSASELTELLRPENNLHPTPEQARLLFVTVQQDYQSTIACVQEFKESLSG